jgi:hypothetical protein
MNFQYIPVGLEKMETQMEWKGASTPQYSLALASQTKADGRKKDISS